MPSSEPTTPKLTVDDINAFNEAELVQYMKQNRRPDGGFDLSVEGWENLPKDHRDQFAERLRIGALKASDEVQSRPVDFDQVAARLLEISDNEGTLPQALSRPSRHERSPTVEISWDEEEKKYETRAYNELVNDDGRPAYPINLLEEVSKDPEEYREMLRPWQEYPDPSTPHWREMFQRQLKRWQDFRHWQQDNRGIHNDKAFSAFIESRKRLDAELGMVEWLSQGKAGASYLEREWDDMQRLRQWEQNKIWEVYGDGGFPKYVEAVKSRLAQHRFTRAFQLEEDPEQQDKLTTWIEYLYFEYCWYDRYTRDIKRLQPHYDEAWRELVDSKVLRPSETAKYLRSDASGFRRHNEEDAARKAVESAKSAAREVLRVTQRARNHPQRSSLTKPVRLQMMAAARSRLEAAKESLRAIKQRNDLILNFVLGTRNYENARKNAEQHSFLLRWIREQVPLIEAESRESEAAKGSSHAEHGTKRKLRRNQDDEATGRNFKKQRRNDQISSLSEGARPPEQGRETSKRNRCDGAVDGQPPKRFKNNSRDSTYQHQNSSDTDITSVGGSQVSRIPEAKRQDGVDKVMLKTRKVPNNRPLRSTGVSQPPAISQQLRRSPRIAARQDRSNIAVVPPQAVKISRQRSHEGITQAPTPPSSADRSPAMKTSRGRDTTEGNRPGTLN